MTIRNMIAASTLIFTTVFAGSAFALVPTSPLHDLTPSGPTQSHEVDGMHDGVVLLFGIDNTPSTTIHDTLAQPGVGQSTFLASAE